MGQKRQEDLEKILETLPLEIQLQIQGLALSVEKEAPTRPVFTIRIKDSGNHTETQQTRAAVLKALQDNQQILSSNITYQVEARLQVVGL
jgi:hypothetical protein